MPAIDDQDLSGRNPPRRPVVFIECTDTLRYDLHTGIQRVVRNILINAPEVAEGFGFDVRPVVLRDGGFVIVDPASVLGERVWVKTRLSAGARLLRELRRLKTQMFGLVPAEFRHRSARRGRRWWRRFLEWTGAGEPAPRSLDDFASCENFILLLLDASWNTPIWPSVDRFKKQGGAVVGVVYDLIPITHGHTCTPELSAKFGIWLRESLERVDGFVCISKYTADTLRSHLRTEAGKGRKWTPVPIGHFHLGAGLDFAVASGEARADIGGIYASDRHVFLMVGSIEPRKMHGYVLDAFERFWAEGGSGALVVVGHHSWMMESYLTRCATHPQLGKQLFIINDVSDSDLAYCYRNASALVIASEAEGFGLPIVEALQTGLPVLCSDIPVFREIGEGKVSFFSLESPDCLAGALSDFCNRVPLSDRKRREPQAWIGWKDSTEQLFGAMTNVLKEGRLRR